VAVLSLLCRKDVISTVVSPLGTNGVEKSGLVAVYPDFSTSALMTSARDDKDIKRFELLFDSKLKT